MLEPARENQAPSDRLDPDASSAVGHVVAGKYRLDARLGGGARGAVFLATELAARRPVVLRVLAATDPASRALFAVRVELAASLHHPCVARILDQGQIDDDTLFCVTELLEGQTVAERLRDCGRLSLEEAAAIVSGVASALDVAHGKGLLHLDLRPSNIFLAQREHGGGDVKVIDFGLAPPRRAGHSRATGTPTLPGLDAAPVAGPGGDPGPWYLAPEQVRGGAVDPRTDVYALAAVLREMIDGEPPFKRWEGTRLFRAIVDEPPAPSPRAAAGGSALRAVDRVILRALAKEPGDRFTGTSELVDAIWRALAEARHSPLPPGKAGEIPLAVRSRPPRRAAIAAALFAAGGAGVLLLLHRAPAPPPSVALHVPALPALPSPPAIAEAKPAPIAVTVAAIPPPGPAPAARPAATAKTRVTPAAIAPLSAAVASPPPSASSPSLRIDDLKTPY